MTMLLSETWLRPSSTLNTHLHIENFVMFRRDHPQKTPSDLPIYVKIALKPRRRDDLEDTSIECITSEISSVWIKQFFLLLLPTRTETIISNNRISFDKNIIGNQ